MANYVEEIRSAYFGCLASYAAHRDEESLETAASLGRRALSAGLGILDVTLMHHEGLALILSAAETAADRRRVLEAASLVLCESLGRFEMTHRGFTEMTREISEVPMMGIAFCRELQTPYQSIMTALSRLNELVFPRRDGAGSRLLLNVLSSMEILGQRIDDLTELVGFRTGLYSIEPRNVDFREILDAVRRKIEHVYGSPASSLLDLSVGAFPTAVRLDAERITRVLAILVGRAVQSSSPEHPAKVRVFTEGASLVVELETREADSSLWERMRRVLANYPGAWVGREIAGLGSALALCLEIVRSHRGVMRVDSESGRTTLVRLELPTGLTDR